MRGHAAFVPTCLVLTCVVLTSCGSGDGGDAVDGDPAAASEVASSEIATSEIASPEIEGGAGTDGIASGARVRVANVYAPLNGEPGPLELYPAPYALEGDTPYGSVAYGTVSEFFDPTVADDAGNMFLSMYLGGTTGNGDALMSTTATLAGGEVITYILATGENVQENGRRFGTLRTFYHGAPESPVPAPGTGSVTVDMIGLDSVVVDPEAYFYVSFGDGCAPAVGDDEFTRALLGPGTSVMFDLAPGSYPASVFTTDDCSGTPVVADVPIEIVEGGQSFLVVYAPAADDLRALFVPAP